jgi:hypothetical protein
MSVALANYNLIPSRCFLSFRRLLEIRGEEPMLLLGFNRRDNRRLCDYPRLSVSAQKSDFLPDHLSMGFSTYATRERDG